MKTLLLGTGASLMAGAALAADLPVVAAEPVDYVRVCDAYGSGFFYLPGTETCLQVGGSVALEVYAHEDTIDATDWAGSPFDLAGGATNADASAWLAKGVVTFDARTETEYGLLRSFIEFEGEAVSAGSGGVELKAAFVQFAGLVAGLGPSILDYDDAGHYGDQIGAWDDEAIQLAYTADFGGGFSATVGVEDINPAIGVAAFDDEYGFEPGPVYGPVAGSGFAGTAFYGDEVNDDLPILIGRLDYEGGWGNVMLGGALRKNSTRLEVVDLATGAVVAEESDDEIGYAVVAGATFNLDAIAEGDQVVLRGAYGEGANTYVTDFFDEYPELTFSTGIAPGAIADEDDVVDLYGIEQTRAWSVYAGYQHYWTPRLRSTFAASYLDADLDTFTGDSQIEAFTSAANLVYSPVSDLDIGIELLYSGIDYGGREIDLAGTGFDSYGDDRDGFGGIFVIERSF